MNSQAPKQPVTSSDKPTGDSVTSSYRPPLLVKMDQLAQVTGIPVVTGAT